MAQNKQPALCLNTLLMSCFTLVSRNYTLSLLQSEHSALELSQLCVNVC